MATLPAWLDWVRPRPRTSSLAEALTSRLPSRGSLVASAALLTADDGRRLAKASKRREWQRASFGYARALPEVGYAMRFLANNAAHIRLYAGDRPPGVDEVAELNDGYGWIEGTGDEADVYDLDALPEDLVQAARAALDELTGYSPSGGGAAILSPLTRNYETAGECYLVGRYFPEGNNGAGREEWAVRSVSELTFQDGRFRGMDPDLPAGYWRLTTGEGRDGEAVDLDPSTTTVYRLWTADAEWSAEPDSPMRSLVGVCERLLLIERGDDAALRSRATGNGVLLWPEELDSIPDDEDEEEDEFDRDFVTQLTTPLTLDGSAAQVVPMIKRGAYQYLDRVRHLTFGRPLDPLTSEREARLLTRLGIGLDVPPEVITGLSDVNHWNAWQISSDTFRHHQEPITIAAVEGLTLGYLRTRLRSAGAWPEDLIRRVVIWFDPSSLVAPADMSSAANDAYDRGLIDGRAYRELRGIDESYAPPEEIQTGDDPVGETGLAVERLLQVATVADRLLRAGYQPDDVNRALGLEVAHTGAIPGVAPGPAALPAGEPVSDEPTTPETPELPAASGARLAILAAAGPTDKQRRLSRRLANIERTLRDRIAAAADAALLRALERAGNRARAAAQRDPSAREAVSGQPPENVLASLGRTVVAALGLEEQQLLAEAFGRLREQYAEWTATAAEEALDAAVGIAGLDRADPDVSKQIGVLRDRFADNVDASWPVLEGGLRDLAADRLYNPDPTVDPLGELPSSIVPPGLVREALAVAGGIPGDASGTGVLNGLTSGQLVDGFLRDHGQEVVEYEWAYGISARPFRPHADLDGVVFAGFDDDALDTSGTGGEWVGRSFAPGDHKGCHCDYVPVYTDGRDTRAELETIGRRAYEEQNPGRPIPTRDATVDERVYREPAGRPAQRTSATAEAARAVRNGPPVVVPPPEPVRPRRQAARGRTRQAATDEAGIPMRLDHTYLSALNEEQLDDLAVHIAARMDSLDPREGQRWDDLDAFLTYGDEERRVADDLAERMASDDEWREAYERLDSTLGRPGVTHPRVGGHGSRDGTPTRSEVQEEYALHVEQQYLDALEVVKTHGVNAAGQARGIEVRDLLAGDIRLVYRYASPELLEFLETNRRISWTEYYFARTGKGNATLAAKHAAENADISRDRPGRRTRR